MPTRLRVLMAAGLAMAAITGVLVLNSTDAFADRGRRGRWFRDHSAQQWDGHGRSRPAWRGGTSTTGPDAGAVDDAAESTDDLWTPAPPAPSNGAPDPAESTSQPATTQPPAAEAPTTPPPRATTTAPAGANAAAGGNVPAADAGTSMPGQLPGWRQVFADDFDGNALDRSIWGAYDGQPSGAPNAWWDPSHVVVHDGMLDLQTYQDSRFGNKWVSGGVSSAPAASLTYGKYLARFRMDDGFGVAGILLLMGRDSWPPEVDFAENGGDNNRQHMSAVLHYSPQNLQVHRTVYADFTQWHTIGVEWTPGKLVYTLDGEAWATVEGDHVPADPMDFDIQAQAGNCAPGWDLCPGAATPAQVNLQVDWVAVYAPG